MAPRAAAVVLTIAAATVGLVAPGSRASFSWQAATANSTVTGTLGAPALECAWTSATDLSLTWADTSPTFTTGYQYRRSDTSGSGYSTIGTTTGQGSNTATDSPPAPVTTPRYYTTKSTHGTWTSTSSNEKASSDCRSAIANVAGPGGTQASPVCSSATTVTRSEVGTGVGSQALAVDPAGTSLYFADTFNSPNCIRRLDLASGTVSWVAGGGSETNCVSTTAADLQLNAPQGVAVDSVGNVYVADTGAKCIRRIAVDGTVTAVIGQGGTNCPTSGPAGDGKVRNPRGLFVDSSDNLYIADTGNNCILRIGTGGAVTTVAGGGGTTCPGSDTATNTNLYKPSAVVVDTAGNVIIADNGNNCVVRITPGGAAETIAGNTSGPSSCSTTGTATAVGIDAVGIALNATGDLFIADPSKHCIRKVVGTTLTSLAGTGSPGGAGDGGPGFAATLNKPQGLAIAPNGDLYINNSADNSVRKIIAP